MLFRKHAHRRAWHEKQQLKVILTKDCFLLSFVPAVQKLTMVDGISSDTSLTHRMMAEEEVIPMT